MKKKPLCVTFDTNTFRDLVEPKKRSNEHYSSYEKIDEAIKAKLIEPFLCDSIVILEGIKKVGRGDFNRKTKMTYSSEESPIVEQLLDGTKIFRRHIQIQPDESHRPSLPPELMEALRLGYERGFQFIKTNRVGQQMVERHLYKSIPLDQLGDVIDRVSDALELIEDAGMGSAQAIEISKEVIAQNPSLQQHGVMRAFNWCGDEKKIARLIAEWSDGDAIAAHYGYGHDVFCTRDEGKSAGVKSVLHSSNRAWLKQKFDLKVASPVELAEML